MIVLLAFGVAVVLAAALVGVRPATSFPAPLGALCLAALSMLCACSSGDDGSDASFADAGLAETEADSASDMTARLRAGGLTSLASAIDVVDISQLFDGAAGFTLLAPSDVAFQSMDPDEMADLLADPENLLAVLRNHVIEQQLGAAELSDLDSVRTQAGNDLVVSESGGVITIGGATVSHVDVLVDEGTVHVVDQLLVP